MRVPGFGEQGCGNPPWVRRVTEGRRGVDGSGLVSEGEWTEAARGWGAGPRGSQESRMTARCMLSNAVNDCVVY